jgi:hypothetical protein
VSPGVWTWERCLGLGDGWSWTRRWYHECGWRANCTARRRTSRPPRGHGGQKGTVRGNVNGGADETACACVSVYACVLPATPSNAYRETGTPSTMPAMWTRSKTGLGWAGRAPGLPLPGRGTYRSVLWYT